ncbi:MAG TPA: ankyrin repeat domain-containing protein [Candidatus Solibacter sp.]|nr:ankyrin repeat domain-containing protein [Candidatus Solibacter sp.]
MPKQLPPRPNLEQLKKQAKALLKGHRAADAEILSRIREYHPRWGDSPDNAIAKAVPTLADAQLIIAREYGFESWPKLKAFVEQHPAVQSFEAIFKSLLDAVRRGDLARINAILDADPELMNEMGGPGVRTALHAAVGAQKEESVKLLLERGANPNIRCEGDNAFPLHFACEKQNFPIIRLLVEHGADCGGEGDYHELGVLGWATAWEYVEANPEIVAYLLAHGARHNIFSAVAVGNTQAIREIVARTPAELERRRDLASRRRMPLHLAVFKKQQESLKTLLDLGANTESLDEAFLTPLDQAALLGEKELAKILIDHGAKIRLPAAIALDRKHDVEHLLSREPDSLKSGGRWARLIIRACEHSSGEIIEALIQAGADVNVRDDPKTAVDNTSGYTALHAAGFKGNLSAVEVLLRHGADVTVREEKYHGTPGGWAAYAGHMAARDLIVRGKVDIMEAVENELTNRVVEILAEDPSALDRPLQQYPLFPLYAEGWYTPLAFAIAMKEKGMVRWLVERGADRNLRSPEGQSLLELAREMNDQEISRMLES